MQLVVNEHRRGDVLELPLLVLPCGAKVALEMRKALLQLRVAVGRQHLRVGVDVDALALGLLQQAAWRRRGRGRRCTMKGPFSMVRDTSTGSGSPNAPVLALSSSAMTAVGHPPGGLHQLRQSLSLVPLAVADGPQRRAEKQVDLAVGIAQHPRVVGVSCHAPQAEQHEGLQALDVRRPAPATASAYRSRTPVQVQGWPRQRLPAWPSRPYRSAASTVCGVEINIGDGGEQSFRQQECLFGGRTGSADVHAAGWQSAMSAPVSLSCASAVSADLPQTPAFPVQAVQFAACSH